jgi:hypothetical protein
MRTPVRVEPATAPLTDGASPPPVTAAKAEPMLDVLLRIAHRLGDLTARVSSLDAAVSGSGDQIAESLREHTRATVGALREHTAAMTAAFTALTKRFTT